jgi:hypothetical protein
MKNVLRKGDALYPFIFNFALGYVIRRVQANQEGLQFRGTYQLLFYAAGLNLLGEGRHTMKETEALLVARRETGLEVNAVRTEYVVVCREQNAGHSHNVKIVNKSFERVECFKYLGATLTKSKFHS